VTPRVVVFGSLNLDLVYDVPRLPRPGETLLGGHLHRSSGGKGGNQAHAAARTAAAGVEVAMVACVGEDEAGEILSADLARAGVLIEHIRHVTEPSGLALIAVDDAGENTIVVVPGANAAWPADLVDSIDFSSGDVVVLQLEIPFAVVEAVVDRATAAGARVVLNVAPCDDRARGLLDRVDVLVVNEGEAAELFGLTGPVDADSVGEARALLSGDVIVTLGKDGAIVASRDGRVDHVTAFDIEATDTVGAGDAFVGGLAAALASSGSLGDAVRIGSAAGALTATVAGARHHRLDRDALDALIGRADDARKSGNLAVTP
jgi:ribokinase